MSKEIKVTIKCVSYAYISVKTDDVDEALREAAFAAIDGIPVEEDPEYELRVVNEDGTTSEWVSADEYVDDYPFDTIN